MRVFSVLRNKDGLRQADRLGAFVNSVCNNVLLEHYRASSRSSSIEEEGEEIDIPDEKADVLERVLTRETVETVREILEKLSERDRRLLREVFLEERDKDEGLIETTCGCCFTGPSRCLSLII